MYQKDGCFLPKYSYLKNGIFDSYIIMYYIIRLLMLDASTQQFTVWHFISGAFTPGFGPAPKVSHHKSRGLWDDWQGGKDVFKLIIHFLKTFLKSLWNISWFASLSLEWLFKWNHMRSERGEKFLWGKWWNCSHIIDICNMTWVATISCFFCEGFPSKRALFQWTIIIFRFIILF